MKRLLFLSFLLISILVPVSAFAQAADEKEVVMSGVGTTEEDAKRQAYRNAVQSVIGAMVVSETIVENDELMRDQVLSHSDGYVTKSQQIGSARALEGGLVEVTMRITVKSQQLREKLQAEKITVAAIDGKGLFAQKVTQDEAKQDAASIVAEKIKNLPAGVLVAEADISASKQEPSSGMVRLTIPVQVSVDKKAYGDFIKDLNSTMTKLGFKATPVTLNQGQYFGLSDFSRPMFDKNSDHPDVKNLFTMALCDLINKETDTSRWRLYSIPKEVFSVALQKNENLFTLTVELRDESGAMITSSEVKYRKYSDRFWRNDHYTNSVIGAAENDTTMSIAVIAPQPIMEVFYAGIRMFDDDCELKDSDTVVAALSVQKDAVIFNLPFELTEEELQSVQSVHCTITNDEE
ncbi:MAG: hypothetical protein LBV80_01310 [Deltaproteobacteria bacterium]|jgi:hypothetical protein|nr:hypothetical protein [Deltaproteobacteria bacterium]